MILLVLARFALAAPTFDGRVWLGGRTAPESTVPWPADHDAPFEPAALAAGALDLGVEDDDGGAWARLSLTAWGYVPEGEANLIQVGPALGFTSSNPTQVDLAARYDAQWFPLLATSSSGRGEALARLGGGKTPWTWTAEGLVIDRRFQKDAVDDFSTAELGARVRRDLGHRLAATVGLAGQANQAEGAFSDGELGEQGRSLLRLQLTEPSWHLALEHRFLVAAGGEVESERRPIFTPLGEYSDDVDALSGGGFVENRVGVTWGWIAGQWTTSISLLARFRQADEPLEEESVFGQATECQLSVERKMTDDVRAFAGAGGATASLADERAYLDAWAWAGVRVTK